MNDKVCLVTGANRGIGRATALAMAKIGANVVMLCRDETAAKAVAGDIDGIVGRRATEVVVADLASLSSVRNAADDVRDRYGSLSILINNAAVVSMLRKVTADGYELQFGVNHLAPFLLTNLLLETLTRNAPSRVVTVASNAHYRGKIYFDDLNAERRRYGPQIAYGQSKLANVLFTRELARRVEDTRVTANSLHPGVIATGLLGQMMLVPKQLHWILKPVFGSVESGAETSVFLATSPDVSNVTGKYFDDCRERTPSKAARDDEAARRLWDASAALVSL